jgi:cell division protein FtsW
MARTLRSDKMLFLLVVLLLGVSVVMVYSATAVNSVERPYFYLSKQLTWVVLGLAVMSTVMRIDYRTYRQPRVIWTVVGLTAILLVAVLFSPPINHARRWFSFGPVSFQPSELAKLAAVLFTAAVLDRRMHRVNDFGFTLLPVGLVTLLFTVLILAEPDFGTSAVLVLVVAAMVFAAGLKYRYLIAASVLAVPASLSLILGSGYRRSRLLTFLDPWKDPQGAGYQIIQSLLAIGSGGLLGRGLMDGMQKLHYLPEAHTDFIYSVIAEELGFAGATCLLLCFALVAWRGLRIASLAPDRFGSLLALGITMIVALQALLNVSVVTSMLPTKGIPLPFVSSGGSSLLVTMIGMGVLLNISQHASVATGSKPVAAWTLGEQEA